MSPRITEEDRSQAQATTHSSKRALHDLADIALSSTPPKRTKRSRHIHSSSTSPELLRSSIPSMSTKEASKPISNLMAPQPRRLLSIHQQLFGFPSSDMYRTHQIPVQLPEIPHHSKTFKPNNTNLLVYPSSSTSTSMDHRPYFPENYPHPLKFQTDSQMKVSTRPSVHMAATNQKVGTTTQSYSSPGKSRQVVTYPRRSSKEGEQHNEGARRLKELLDASLKNNPYIKGLGIYCSPNPNSEPKELYHHLPHHHPSPEKEKSTFSALIDPPPPPPQEISIQFQFDTPHQTPYDLTYPQTPEEATEWLFAKVIPAYLPPSSSSLPIITPTTTTPYPVQPSWRIDVDGPLPLPLPFPTPVTASSVQTSRIVTPPKIPDLDISTPRAWSKIPVGITKEDQSQNGKSQDTRRSSLLDSSLLEDVGVDQW